MTASRELPASRAIFAVDVEKFTRNPSARQPELSDAIEGLLRSAFRQCGLDEVWEMRRFPQSTGDGYMFGVPEQYAPYLVDPLLDRLQNVLAEHDRQLRAQDRNLRLRLRAAIHMGPVPDSDDRHDGIGTPVNDTFRLLDSGSIRDELSISNPDTTLLVAILSQRIFEDVVRGGFTPEVPPDRLRPVIAEVAGKEFAQPAWIYVPRASQASDRVLPLTDQSSGGVEPVGQPPGGTTINGSVGNAITGGTFSAEVKQMRDGRS